MKSSKTKIRRGVDTKGRIFQAAAELFNRKGYDGVSIREICEEVGVGKPTLYYYFKDKDSLLLALIDEAYRLGFAFFSEHVKPHRRWIDKFHGLLKAAAIYSQQYPELVRFFLLMPQMSLPSSIEKKAVNLKRAEVKYFTNLLEEGRRENYIAKTMNVELLLVLILGSIQLMLTKSDSSDIHYPWHAHDFEDLFTFLDNNLLHAT